MMQESSIQEAIKELSISKGTLYYRMNKCQRKLGSHISTRSGKKYISIEGLEILRNSGCSDKSSNSLNECLDILDDENKADSTDAVELLKSENEFLRNQLLEKDSQIQALLRQNENNQILLKQQQDFKLLPTQRENRLKEFFSKCFGRRCCMNRLVSPYPSL